MAVVTAAAERGERLAAPNGDDETWNSQGFYFAAAEEHVSYHELGRLVGEALGRRRTRVISTGPLVVWSAAAVSDLACRVRGRVAFLNIDKAREARAGHWVCSPQKAADQLGFSTAKPLVDRLGQAAQWYVSNGKRAGNGAPEHSERPLADTVEPCTEGEHGLHGG